MAYLAFSGQIKTTLNVKFVNYQLCFSVTKAAGDVMYYSAGLYETVSIGSMQVGKAIFTE